MGSPERCDLAVVGGTVMTPSGPRAADMRISGGRIVALVPRAVGGPGPGSALATIDASGCVVLPGAIDAHVHFREPGLTHKEDWEHASLAAVAGGVTTVLDMPNVLPPTRTGDALAEKAAAIAGRSRCHFGLYGGMTAGGGAELTGLAAAGAIGFKVFLGETTASLPAPDDGELLACLAQAAALGRRTMVHAENGDILRAAAARSDWPDRTDLHWHGLARPPIAEVEAIARVCLLAAEVGAPLAIAHLSTAAGVAELRRRKADGALDLCVETCPHYLLLTAEEVRPLRGLAKVNPPIRQARDRDALWAGVADGTIDTLGSDHAPHAAAEKGQPHARVADTAVSGVSAAPEEAAETIPPDLCQVAAGFAGVQNTVGLLLAEVVAGRLALRRLVELCAEAPARAWGLWPRKGVIAVGADADLALWRLGAPLVPPRQWSLHPDGPLLRLRQAGGTLVATVVGGELAFSAGAPVGPPGGRWVRPTAREGFATSMPLERTEGRRAGA